MLPRKWSNLERQRPRLRWAKWGTLAGLALTVMGAVGIGSWGFGLMVMAASVIWGATQLK